MPSHCEAVRSISLPGIVTGNATFQQTVPDWEEWGAGYLSALQGGGAIGAADRGMDALSPVMRRRAFRGVAEVSIYLTESASGCGIGARRN